MSDSQAETPGSGDELIRAVDLTKTYPDGQVTAMDHISVVIRKGEYVAIMGPSGSGKSTLLCTLGGLDRPDSGELYFEGQRIDAGANLDRLRSEKIGFVFQSFYLLPTLTAAENVQIPMFEGPRSARERAEKAAELLAVVGMSHRAKHHPNRLSVGERQRVAIARSLANDPVLLLADEPTGNLDSKTEREILELFARLHDEHGMTLIVVTHSDDVGSRAQRMLHIRDGKLIQDSAAVASS